MVRKPSIEKAAKQVRVAPKDVEVVGDKELQKQEPKKGLITHSRQELFVGPIPHPDILARYGEIVNNGAERIVRMAEKQMKHRIELENKLAECDIRQSDRGLIFGFVIALAITCGGIWITVINKSIFGFIAMLTPMAVIIGLFIYTRQNPKDKQETKKPVPAKRKTKK